MNIIKAIKDENLFRPYLADRNDRIASWRNWICCLRVIYGLPLRREWQRRVVRQCTRRDPDKLDPDGYQTVLLLCGRRSGKSKIGGLIGAHEASLGGRETVCSPGELPMVSIVSPSKDQSEIIQSYIRAALSSPLLEAEITREVRQQFRLSNNVTVRVLTGDFKAVRAYTQVAVVVDEVCFFGYTEESRVKNDTELIRSIKPSLLTTHGKLVCVSTKYAARGWAHAQWKRHFGDDASRILVWDAASRVMNPTLDQGDIDAEIADDPAAARSEYLNLWREDVQNYLPRQVVEAVVIAGRTELLPRSGIRYVSFTDVSGGRSDPMALCVGHRERDTKKTVIDFIREFRAPCNPTVVIGDIASDLKRYGLSSTSGDAYAAEFVVQAFARNGVKYLKSAKGKSELYLELIGPVCAREIELPDHERLVGQIASLERRTRSGGRDVIDHPSGGHDDLANVVAGVCVAAGRRVVRAGFGPRRGPAADDPLGNRKRLALAMRGGRVRF